MKGDILAIIASELGCCYPSCAGEDQVSHTDHDHDREALIQCHPRDSLDDVTQIYVCRRRWMFLFKRDTGPLNSGDVIPSDGGSQVDPCRIPRIPTEVSHSPAPVPPCRSTCPHPATGSMLQAGTRHWSSRRPCSLTPPPGRARQPYPSLLLIHRPWVLCHHHRTPPRRLGPRELPRDGPAHPRMAEADSEHLTAGGAAQDLRVAARRHRG